MKTTTEKLKPEGTGAQTRNAVGAGLITLDIIVEEESSPKIAHVAGGTCGNVVAALAFLGWQATPVGRLGDDAAGDTIRGDFATLGIPHRELTRERSVSSARIVQFLVQRRTGIRHRFAFSCPTCGTPFARFRPPTLGQAEAVLANHRAPDVFFFDRVSTAIKAMAAEFRRRGALICFEPSGTGRPKDLTEALALSHIVKYSEDRMHGALSSLRSLKGERVEIETLGSRGLRFRRVGNGHGSPWRTQQAFKVRTLRDAAGAGDWCTAGLLFQLDWKNGREFSDLKDEELASALMFGQALAALNCQHLGARGLAFAVDPVSTLASVVRVQANGLTDTPSRPAVITPPVLRQSVRCRTCLRE